MSGASVYVCVGCKWFRGGECGVDGDPDECDGGTASAEYRQQVMRRQKKYINEEEQGYVYA